MWVKYQELNVLKEDRSAPTYGELESWGLYWPSGQVALVTNTASENEKPT